MQFCWLRSIVVIILYTCRPRPGTGGSVVSTRIKSNNVVKTGALAPASGPKNEYYRLIKNPNPVASIRTNRQLQNGTLEMGVKGLLENDEYVGSTWQVMSFI